MSLDLCHLKWHLITPPSTDLFALFILNAMMTRALACFVSAHNADVSHTANSNTQLMLLYEANE